MHEGKRGRKYKRRGKHGVCTYCGKQHKSGADRVPSCRGHSVRRVTGTQK